MASLLIKNGRVIDPVQRHDAVADVLILNGVIKGIGQNLTAAASVTVFDATDLIVAPGFVDMLAQPSMIKRPVLEIGKTILIGFKPEVYAQQKGLT